MIEKKFKSPTQVILFMTQDVYVCMDLTHIQKVLPLSMIEAVPGTEHYLVGLMNLSGKSIPVIDLALRMNLGRKDVYSLDTPILICSHQKHEAGIIVDKIIGLHMIDRESLQMHDEFNKEESVFLGTINVNSKFYLLLNIDKVLDISFNLENINHKVTQQLTKAAQSPS